MAQTVNEYHTDFAAPAGNTKTSSAYTITPGAAVLILVACDQPVTINTPVSSKGDTVTAMGASVAVGTDNQVRGWYIKNAVGGAGNTFTVSASGTFYGSFYVVEIPGSDTTAPFDSAAYASATSSSGSPFAVTSGTPAQSDYVAVSLCGTNSGSNPTTYTPTAGWSSDSQTDGGQYWTSGCAWKIVSGGSGTVPISWAVPASGGARFIAIIKAGAAGISLAGAASTATQASATLSTGAGLSGAASSGSSSSASLQTTIRVSGAAISTSSAGAQLSTTVAVAGQARSASTAAATLTTSIALQGAAQSRSAASATLQVAGALSGAAVSSSAASASLTTGIRLQGAASSPSSASASLGIGASISGAAATGSAASATLQTVIAIAGAAASSARAVATLSTGAGIAGAAASKTSAAASLTTAIALSGGAASQSSAVATLIFGQPIGEPWLVDARSTVWLAEPRANFILVEPRGTAWISDKR